MISVQPTKIIALLIHILYVIFRYELYEESLEDRHNDGLSETVSNTIESENLTDVVSSARTDHGTIATHNLHVGQVEGVITTAPSVQVIPQLACPPVTYTLAYPTAPYGYMQSVTPFPHSPMPLHAAYVPSPAAYPYGALTNLSYYTPSATSTTHLRHSTPGLYTNQVVGVPVSRAQSVLPLGGHAVMATQSPPTPAIPSQQQQIQNPISQLNQQQMGYLLAAYRVGMLAMETLARRVHDDRPQAKYARNPPYGEDVKWLLNVAKKLGK
ncbi:zinc finger SWIM domain-containing protein 8-like [Centruroides sculpturatus]|uniref:zinc finger SWIM domain-containing protein 8-like n=1 Tax=Centruroides sculpturatus TaxID=218467 RepID=UPI000C6ECBB7|nr:zinc finger SWIM domain-containing protein 8-like [Centruroides sculpturatus]